MPLPDQHWIAQSLDGHPEAFGQLVRRYQGPLLAYLTGRLGDSERAEEAAQETFVRAFMGLDRLRKTEAFFSWLLGIAARVAREQDRFDRRRRELTESDHPASPAPGPPTTQEDEELRRAITALPQIYAEVVLLRYYGNCSCADVARQLDLPLGTVTKRLSRAYALLRQALCTSNKPPQRTEVSK